MTPNEETARQAFEKWKSELPKCLDTCDGDLVGEEHDADCPLFGKGFATMLNAFQAGVAHGMEAQKWVSVEKRLPEIGAEVLAWKPVRGFDLVKYSQASENHRKFARRDGQWWERGDQITHWQPLSAPPAKEDERA